MAAIDYRIWAGPVACVSDGNSPTVLFDVGLHAKAKRNPYSDYEVANELIAVRLGQSIGLPIPSGVPLEMEGERYFSSLIGASTGASMLPPGNAAIAAKMDPRAVCGTIVFDAWICNLDRHNRNFHFDEEDRQLYLIDHGNALFGANGQGRLKSSEGKIGLIAEMHHLAREIRDFSTFDDWEERILQLPQFLIRDAVYSAEPEGISLQELDYCFEFLLARRTSLRSMFSDSQDDASVFPKLGSGTLFRVTRENDQQPEYYI